MSTVNYNFVKDIQLRHDDKLIPNSREKVSEESLQSVAPSLSGTFGTFRVLCEGRGVNVRMHYIIGC